jgi:putative hemolysin
MPKKYIIFLLVLLVIVLAVVYFYLVAAKKPPVSQPAAIANPASVYCQEQGGVSEIRTNPDGSQTGFCIFPDNSECDEWAFYRQECSQGQNKPTGT